MAQIKLSSKQIQNFYVDCFAENQVDDFINLLGNTMQTTNKTIVDIGGGIGVFAMLLHSKTGYKIRIIDSDEYSISIVSDLCNDSINGIVADAFNPVINGDEGIICFNLILHHLVDRNEYLTRRIQSEALKIWRDKSDLIFINEYIYESYCNQIGSRLIYEITRNKIFSGFGRIISQWIPSLRANTFGVGVRFRSHDDWLHLFAESGYNVIGKICGNAEYIALPRRLLLIREIRRDSFLLARRY